MPRNVTLGIARRQLYSSPLFRWSVEPKSVKRGDPFEPRTLYALTPAKIIMLEMRTVED